jgi:hypothetical membrane protein
MFKLLMLPLVYACIVGTVFREWAHAHPIITWVIFIFLCAMPVLYAIRGVCKFFRELEKSDARR